jgi:AbrB family looped-hinge helix DNA binding protein
MSDMEEHDKQVVRAKTRISANGRIVIPAAIREALGVKAGDSIVMEAQDGVLRIESYPTMVARIQREFAHLIPPGVSLVDELLADRREEARREQEEIDRVLEQDRLRKEGKIA